MIKVTDIEMTCGACPSQWEGHTDDDRQIYVRYRWGNLTIEVSEPGDTEKNAAVFGELVFEAQCGDGLSGIMSYNKLKELTKDVIEFPEVETR